MVVVLVVLVRKLHKVVVPVVAQILHLLVQQVLQVRATQVVLVFQVQQIMVGLVAVAVALVQLGSQPLHLVVMLQAEMVALDWPQVSLALKFFTVVVAVVD
jgi:hypothetical protein